MQAKSWRRSFCALFAAVCSCFELGGPPIDTGVPSSPPSQPAPTGTRWEGRETTDACGRKTIAWVMVDEVCGGSDRADHLAALRVPMFRDGALVGDRLFAVDATHLWVLDVADPTRIARVALVAGLGQPLAVRARGAELVVAAGADGLVVVDVTDPAAPVRAGALALPGPALDVHVDGGIAYVAMGKAGVAVVDLEARSPALIRTLSLGLKSAYAAGVTARDGRVYVAACSTLAVLDAKSGALLGHAWRPDAVADGVLVAPAKDVELVGDTAFVAAGRFGAVAVDVKDPSKPTVLGNCTEPSDLAFYASGVRASDQALFVAGGEWGIKSIPVAGAATACTASVLPKLAPAASGSVEVGECSTKPPWKLLPWEDLWTPPPPRKDPVQVLPASGRVYAFGDARRVGTRAVDVRDALASLKLLGRYDEPRLHLGIAAAKDTVLVWGPGGRVYRRTGTGTSTSDEAKLLLAVDSPAPTGGASAGAVLPDGRWALVGGKSLHVEGLAQPVSLPADVEPRSLAARSGELVLATRSGALLVDAKSGTTTTLASPRTAELPASVAASEAAIYVAAPEWIRTRSWSSGKWSDLGAHGVFDDEEILDVSRWRTALPRRLLAAAPSGLAEVATLAGAAALVRHPDMKQLALPAATYVGLAADASDRLYLASVDRGTYRSQLLSIDLSGVPKIVATESFTGIATGVAAAGDRLYVSDADRGIHVFKLGPAQAPARLGIVAAEVKP